ncbi:hypothetical protein ASPBRDRAFT_657434 [Aspergillus brasiliensis CBS 101740]|uniref:Uncharacterized protein n=1 Tax=Aspergillus brasiliensis (strain CBS 101740 / IMI 381727 / IBT 21946) TaxID=767769 RepID=A0A1L9UCT7_ASPBC|nr:hypothetical protein ASPBRDRAFT_657434 [Aspergillus brasiliensis CBS 101740]
MQSRDACLPSPFESWESAQAPPQPARLFRCLTCLNTKLCHLRGSLVKVFAASGIGQINRATHSTLSCASSDLRWSLGLSAGANDALLVSHRTLCRILIGEIIFRSSGL